VTARMTTTEVTALERYDYIDLTDELQRAIKDSGVTDGAAIGRRTSRSPTSGPTGTRT
jgi:thiamine phosphate synthase YjbQ (UPF0047 family)